MWNSMILTQFSCESGTSLENKNYEFKKWIDMDFSLPPFCLSRWDDYSSAPSLTSSELTAMIRADMSHKTTEYHHLD